MIATRRQFLATGVAALATQSLALGKADVDGSPASAVDWEAVRRLFDVPEDHAALQNGSANIPFAAALDAATESYRTSHDPLTPFADLLAGVESVRRQVASSIAADPECVAILRNTTEAMRTVQFGLQFQPGDEVLAASVDYDLVVWRQNLVRQGVTLRTFDLPVPAPSDAEIVAMYERQMGPRTRYLLISEVVSASGQALPVAPICAAARARGILTFVDGAQGYALSGATVNALGCDCYAASLHKWFGGPRGTGFLYLRSELIPRVWPLLGNYYDVGQRGRIVGMDDIRKFEQVGTVPTALWAAQSAAFPFLEQIPANLRRGRLQALRDRLMDQMHGWAGVKFLHGRGQSTLGMACFAVEGRDPVDLVRRLRAERVLVRALDEGNVRGVRVSPAIYTREAEIDRFTVALDRVLRAA